MAGRELSDVSRATRGQKRPAPPTSANARLRSVSDYGLLIASLLAGGYATWMLRQDSIRFAGVMWPWWLLLAAAILGGVALLRMESWTPDAQPAARPVAFPSIQRRLWGLISLLSAFVLATYVVVRLWPNYHEWQGTPLLWVGALLLTLAGGWLLGAVGGGSESPDQPEPSSTFSPTLALILPRWLEIALFIGILALAIFVRTYRLSTIPAAIYVDETNASLDALFVLEGRPDSPFGTGWYETPNGYIYYMAGLYKLFGANYLTLKAASLIPAILTIPAVYVLGRLLFGPLAGLFAMFLMAVSRWHMTMSRWGWNELMPPLFQVLATFFLIRGLRERRALDYTVGGLLTGLVVYTYLSSRLAIATLGLFVIYWLLTDPAGPNTAWKRHWRGLILYGVAATIAVAPIAVTYITDPFTFYNRAAEINIFHEVQAEGSLRPLRENIWRHVQLFYQQGDPTGRQNLPGEPQTDPVTGMLMAIGLAYGLLRLRDRRRGLLWIWLIIAMAGGYLSELHIDSPNSYRTLTAVPAIALLGGDVLARLILGAHQLARFSIPARHRTEERQARPGSSFALGVALVTVLLAYTGYTEIDTYFNRQNVSPAVKSSFNLMETRTGQEVVEALQQGTDVYLSHRFYNFSPLRFLVYGAVRDQTGTDPLEEPPFHLMRPEVDLPVPSGSGDALILLDSYYWSVIDYVRRFYPNAQIEQVPSFDGEPLYVRVRITAQELASIQGLNVQLIYEDGRIEERRVAQVGPVEHDGATSQVEWQGSVRVEESGWYDLVAGETAGDTAIPMANLAVAVDDEPWVNPRFLGRGIHKLRVVWGGPLPDRDFGLFWFHSNGDFGPVPPQTLFTIEPPLQGLMGTYFDGETWSGEPIFRQLTPFLLMAWPPNEPLSHPFSARFTGSLRIERPGFYQFKLNADDGVRFVLDGQVLGEGLTPDQPNSVTAGTDLDAGEHPLRIDYFQRGGGSALEFFWRPPGGDEAPVPPDVLIPGD
jgi:hypothetical protein